MNNQFDLDTPLLRFGGEDDSSAFTIRSACEAALIFGNTGAGKTSGSGRTLALKYLEHGFGGMVLTCKADEVDSWREYSRLSGRENDLIVVEPKAGNYFNFLEYESTVRSELSYAQNLVQLLKTVIEASEERSKGKSDDAFWENALEVYITHTINLCLLAYDKINIQLLFDIAQSAPRQQEKPQAKPGDRKGDKQEVPPQDTPFSRAMKITKAKLRAKVNDWKSQQSAEYIESLSNEEFESVLDDAMPELRSMRIMHQFFTDGLFRISEKTRGTIDFCFTGFLHRLLGEPIYSLLCKKPSTFTPEDCLDGKIVVVNLPIKIYDKVGQDAQTICKYVFQRAWERRNTIENNRPVFLWADEAQYFLHPHDTIFQTTARSSRIAVVYLTQNLPGLFANMGGEGSKSEHKVKSFLATLTTKFFHTNNCMETNEFASSLIGEAYTEDVSSDMSIGQGFSYSKGSSYSLERLVRPEAFTRLKTGGPQNSFIVEAYIHCQAKTFKNNCSHRKIQFIQKPNQ